MCLRIYIYISYLSCGFVPSELRFFFNYSIQRNDISLAWVFLFRFCFFFTVDKSERSTRKRAAVVLAILSPCLRVAKTRYDISFLSRVFRVYDLCVSKINVSLYDHIYGESPMTRSNLAIRIV